MSDNQSNPIENCQCLGVKETKALKKQISELRNEISELKKEIATIRKAVRK